MSYNLFVPEVQSAMLLARIKRKHVYAQAPIVNTDWQGEISAIGDTVRIIAGGKVTIRDYVKGTDMTAAEQPADSETALSITQAKYFNYGVSDVDAAIMRPQVMANLSSEAEDGMNDAIDTYIAGLYTSAGVTYGSSGSEIVLATSGQTLAYDALVHVGTLLDQNDVPSTNRWAVVNPWIKELLLLDARFTGYNTPTAIAALQTGKLTQTGNLANNYLGQLNGMDVFWSNNAPHISGTAGQTNSIDIVLAGSGLAVTYAEGLTKVEAYRPEKRMEDAVKGIHLYGAKVIRPDNLCALRAKKG